MSDKIDISITTQGRLRERIKNRHGTEYTAYSEPDGWGYDAELDSRAADRIDELTKERDELLACLDHPFLNSVLGGIEDGENSRGLWVPAKSWMEHRGDLLAKYSLARSAQDGGEG